MTDSSDDNPTDNRQLLADWKLPTSGIICISDSGEILDANKDALSILGYFDQGAVKSEPIYNYIYTQHEEHLKAEIKQALESSRTRSINISIIGPGQEVVKVHMTLTPYLNEPSNGKLIAIFNIIKVDPPGSDKDDACYNNAVESIKNLIGADTALSGECPGNEPTHDYWIFKIDGSGTIRSWNQYCARYFGYGEEDVVGKKTLYDLLIPGQTGGANIILKSAISGEKNFKGDLKFAPRPGGVGVRMGHLDVIRCMECQGKNSGYVCLFYPLDEEEDDVVKDANDISGNVIEPELETEAPIADVLLADVIEPARNEVPSAIPVDDTPTPPPGPAPAPAPVPPPGPMPPHADMTGDETVDDSSTKAEPPEVNTALPEHFLGYNDMAIVGSDGDIKFITENFIQKLGFSSMDEIREHNWFEFMTRQPGKETFCEPTRLPCKTREGTVVETDLQVIPLPDRTGRLTDALWLLNREEDEDGFDPRSREPEGPPGPDHAEAVLKELDQDLVALNIIATVTEQYGNFTEMAVTVMDTVSGIISVEYGGLYLLDGTKLRLVSSVGFGETDNVSNIVVDGDLDRTAEIVENAFKAGIKEIIRSSLMIPLQSNGTSYGYMAFASTEHMEFSKKNMEFLNTTAHLLTTRIQRNLLREDYDSLTTEYGLMYENTPEIYIDINEKGEIKMCNRNAYTALGCDKQRVNRKNILELFKALLGDDFRKFTNWLRTAEDSETTPSIDLKFTLKNGETSYYNVSAWHWESRKHDTRNGFRLILRDITNYYKVRSYHRSSEELMDQIFNATNDLVLYVDTTRTIIECNNSARELLGYDRDEVRGQPLNMIYTNDLLMERYYEEIDKVYSSAEGTREVVQEQVIRKKDGSMFVALVTTCMVRNDRGDTTGMALYIRDITSSKQQAIELMELKKESTFYINVLSNDAKGYNECALSYLKLLKGTELQDIQKNYVEMAIDQVESGIRLSDNVKKFSTIKDESPNFFVVDLNRILRRTAYSILEKSYIEDNLGRIQLKFDYPEGLYGVKADKMIDELFSNIFWNAVKHNSHENKIIEISIKQPEDKSEAYWQIEISDNAFGIPDEDKTIICNPHDEKSGEKSGMGLSIINALVERYGGRIWVENRVSDDYKQGSIFKILLKKSRLEAARTVYGFGAHC